jgi:hypothetical protein
VLDLGRRTDTVITGANSPTFGRGDRTPRQSPGASSPTWCSTSAIAASANSPTWCSTSTGAARRGGRERTGVPGQSAVNAESFASGFARTGGTQRHRAGLSGIRPPGST